LTVVAFRQGRTYRLVATRANGQPAFGAYVRDPLTGVAHAAGLLGLTLAGPPISAMTRFDNSVLPRFRPPRPLPRCARRGPPARGRRRPPAGQGTITTLTGSPSRSRTTWNAVVMASSGAHHLRHAPAGDADRRLNRAHRPCLFPCGVAVTACCRQYPHG